MHTKIVPALACSGLALAFAAGWWLRGPAETPRTTAEPARAATPVATLIGTRPLIVVTDDGHVTLRVEHQPLGWVLDEIARLGGLTDVRGRAAPAASRPAVAEAEPAAADGACPAPPEAPPSPDAARLLQAIERGSEDDRHDGLLAARNDGLTLAPTTLRRIWETDASERVRLLAFEAWLEQQADAPGTTRQALEAVLLLPGTMLQAEARRRLDEQAAAERPDPADPQVAP
jgi:hypothetical protein